MEISKSNKKLKLSIEMNGSTNENLDSCSQNNEVLNKKTNGLSEHTEQEYNDPFCNPKKPHIVNFQDITSAAFLIKGGVDYTPCPQSHLGDETGMQIFLKEEFLQYTGSFKDRGARYSMLMLNDEQKNKGIITASLGNHAQAVSYHGSKLGLPVTVVMPVSAPIMKIQKCRKYGARVIVRGDEMNNAKSIAMKMAHDENLIYINGYDHPHIIAGQGTIGLEIIEQVPNPDAIIIPVGGGGLIAGIAVAIKALSPTTKIIGVESENCPSFSNALQNGIPTSTTNLSTLADGLAVPKVGYNAFATAASLIDKIVVVKEKMIALSILRLVEMEKCVVEGGGAAGLAGILSGQLDEFKGKKVVIVLSGGNIDTTMLGRCLERGLATEGRLIWLIVTVRDGPGGILGLCQLIASLGVSVKDIMHERAWLKDVNSVEVKVICETRDWEHGLELKKVLLENYNEVTFIETPCGTQSQKRK